eukprot:TRINITY_DN16106_c0_g1_i1.p1 TRINITY_DN16106_c0_g1~~TRINITY_DN16106_c0_g1_i1.p1  ORF type:complete len:286 (-),score=80.72 TRINITY_DN16106_c0_g1_i1:54-911(-)
MSKAAGLMAEAEKKLKSFSLFGGNAKYEAAAELFVQAGNSFKVNKQYAEGGEAYLKAAENYAKVKSNHEAATNFINAASCLKKVKIEAAVIAYKQAISIYADDGRFTMAGKNQQDLADMLKEENDIPGAMEAYQAAADFYEGDNQPSRANACLLEVAHFAASASQYDRAIPIFEGIGKKSVENNLLKWGAKEHFFKAILCYLANGDTVGAKRGIEQFSEIDVTFASSREAKFVTALVESTEQLDIDAFTQAVVEFDSITKLDPWKTTMLLRAKNNIKAEQGEALA